MTQQAVNYLAEKYYKKGLKHNMIASVIVCVLVGIIGFYFGRTVEYAATVGHIDNMIVEHMKECN